MFGPLPTEEASDPASTKVARIRRTRDPRIHDHVYIRCQYVAMLEDQGKETKWPIPGKSVLSAEVFRLGNYGIEWIPQTMLKP